MKGSLPTWDRHRPRIPVAAEPWLQQRSDPAQPLPLIVAGPTGSGKSTAALLVAERLDGEIVSVDAMQVYTGMDIGTAKPSAADRVRVRHHLLDIAAPTEGFSAGQFAILARLALADIQRRGSVPILCGGTGLYFKALFEGLGRTPPAQSALRADLDRLPLDLLLPQLEQADPETFQRIDRRNRRRVLRALEIIRATGRPAAELKAAWAPGGAVTPPAVGLTRPRAELRSRIEARVEEMFRLGLVEETRALLGCGLGETPTAMQAIGYRQVVEYLHGVRSLEATIDLVKTKTRQLAKRQMTWFRRQMRLRWIEWPSDWPADRAADEITRYYQTRSAEDPDRRGVLGQGPSGLGTCPESSR